MVSVPDEDGVRVMRQPLVLTALLQKLQQPGMLTRIPELVVALNDAVKTDILLDVQAGSWPGCPISRRRLSFTNIEGLVWLDYMAGGAWIYQGDWTTRPGYGLAWWTGDID